MQNEIFVIGGKIFKSKNALLNNIRESDRRIVDVYEKVATFVCEDYKSNLIKTRERDFQIRSVLGELNKDDILYDFILKYQNLPANNDIRIESYRKYILKNLKNLDIDKKKLSAFIVRHKRHFLEINNEVDWYVTILKIHNFRNHIYLGHYWSPELKKYVKRQEPDIVKENFQKAKDQLRKKNK